jgi:hypothetical protein
MPQLLHRHGHEGLAPELVRKYDRVLEVKIFNRFLDSFDGYTSTEYRRVYSRSRSPWEVERGARQTAAGQPPEGRKLRGLRRLQVAP